MNPEELLIRQHETQMQQVINDLSAALEAAEEHIAEAEAYAAEGWAWLDDALKAGGWASVFDIPREKGHPT